MDMKQWSKIKNQGIIKYVVFHWIICAALPAAVVLHIVRCAVNSWAISYMISAVAMRNLLFGFVICTVISIVLGLFTWSRYNKRYKS
jgi:TRAP-type uncharacterized transport system fused permease subunit